MTVEDVAVSIVQLFQKIAHALAVWVLVEKASTDEPALVAEDDAQEEKAAGSI